MTPDELRILDLIERKRARDLEQVGDSDRRAPINFHYDRIQGQFMKVVNEYHRWLNADDVISDAQTMDFVTFYQTWVPRSVE